MKRMVMMTKLDLRIPLQPNQAKFSTHTAFFFHNAHLWNELRNVMLVTALIIVYLVCMAPYVVRVKVDQIMQVFTCKQKCTLFYY